MLALAVRYWALPICPPYRSTVFTWSTKLQLLASPWTHPSVPFLLLTLSTQFGSLSNILLRPLHLLLPLSAMFFLHISTSFPQHFQALLMHFSERQGLAGLCETIHLLYLSSLGTKLFFLSGPQYIFTDDLSFYHANSIRPEIRFCSTTPVTVDGPQ